MIDLRDTSALSLKLKSSVLLSSTDIFITAFRRIRLQHILPALLNKSLFYPEKVYSEYFDIFHKKDLKIFNENELHYEILLIPAGLLGIEFIKTHIYFSKATQNKVACVVQCLHGKATILLQKNKPKEQFDLFTSVKEGYLITLRRGEKITIPTGYFYTFINTTNSSVVIARIFKKHGIINYNLLNKEGGLAYFAIRKNARTEIVFNPRYKNIPKIKKIRPKENLIKFDLTKEPIYKSVLTNTDYILSILIDNNNDAGN